jgi:hypothetical protein
MKWGTHLADKMKHVADGTMQNAQLLSEDKKQTLTEPNDKHHTQFPSRQHNLQSLNILRFM